MRNDVVARRAEEAMGRPNAVLVTASRTQSLEIFDSSLVGTRPEAGELTNVVLFAFGIDPASNDDFVFLTHCGEWLRLPTPSITKPNWMGSVKLMVAVHRDVNVVQLFAEASHEGSNTTHVLPCTGNTKLAVVNDLLLKWIDNLAERVLRIDDQKIDFLRHD